MARYRIKDWFSEKMNVDYTIEGFIQDDPYRPFMKVFTYYVKSQEFDEEQIERESEKAYLVSVLYRNLEDTKTKTLKKWVPKSAIETMEAYMEREGAKAQRIEEIGWKAYCNERYEQKIASYEALVQWAKENGVKGVRMKMKRATIYEKIREAGLQVPQNLAPSASTG